MPAKSKGTTSDSTIDDENFEFILTEIQVEDVPELDQWLLEKGLLNVDEVDADGDGRTALWTAAQRNNIQMVPWLIQVGKASVDKADKNGTTPLLIATQNSRIEIVVWLVEQGKASVDKANKDGATPLYVAAQNGYIKIVVWLVEQGKASVDKACKDGATPLYIAAQNGYTDIVVWLVEQGKASVDKACKDGPTPLYIAAQNGYLEIVVWLVKQGKASVDKACKNGVTPLYIAAQNGYTEIVVWLVKQGKASVDKACKNGMTPLFIAAYMGHDKMVRWLIGEGNASVDQANDVGETPLFAAVLRCSQGILRQANSETMPLSSAGCKCDMDMLRWLVEEGNANVNTVSASGATPLLAALCAKVVNIDVVQFLLSVEARVGDLNHPVFVTSYAKASILKEVQKLEVPIPTLFLHHFLSTFNSLLILHMPLFVCEGGSHRARDARGADHRALRYCQACWGVHGVA
jgi:ankyrin repeat protein